MAKFCTSCGKELMEGKACSCGGAKETPVTKTASTGNIGKDLVEIAKGMLIAPIATAKKYSSEKNVNIGYILLAIALVAPALFVIALTNELQGAFASIMLLMGGDIGDVFSAVEVDYFEVFIYSVLSAAAVYGSILLGKLIIVNKVMKTEVSIKKHITNIGVASVVNSIAWLLSTLLLFIFADIIAAVILLAGIMFIVTLYNIYLTNEKVDENKFPLMTTAIYAIVFVVLYILIQIAM